MSNLNTFLGSSNILLGFQHQHVLNDYEWDLSWNLNVDTTNSAFIIFDSSNIEDLKYRLSNRINKNTFESLLNQYNKQKRKFGEYIEDNIDFTDSIFFELASKIFELNPSKIKVSLTDSPSLFFKVELRDNYKLRYEVFLRENNSSSVFSLYQLDKLIARTFGTIDSTIEEIKEEMGLNLNITQDQIIAFADPTEYTM